MKVSALVITFNEQRNVDRCLSALSWCDDILVLDSGSTDQTVSIAQQHGARLLFRPFDNFANHRNFGLDHGNFKYDWVLHLDADEVVTPALQDEIQLLAERDDLDGYQLPSKVFLNGRWLRYAGMYPTHQVRLGHRSRMRFRQVGHGQREDVDPARIGFVKAPYLHYSFSHGLRPWLLKHVGYASDEAALIVAQRKSHVGAEWDFRTSASRQRTLKSIATRLPLPLRPAFRFLYLYVIRQGFRDGYAGFLYSFMLAAYEAMVAILALELLGRQKAEDEDIPEL